MEKRPSRVAFLTPVFVVWHYLSFHTARRSVMTERSERMTEEAE